MSKSNPSYMKDSKKNTNLLLTGPSLNVTTIGLLDIFPMNAESQNLRREEVLVMAVTTRKSTLIFSDPKKHFLSAEKGWAVDGEDSDEEDFINLALMAALRGA